MTAVQSGETEQQAKEREQQERKERQEKAEAERRRIEEEQRIAAQAAADARAASLRLTRDDAESLKEQAQQLRQKTGSLAARVEGLSPGDARAVVAALAADLKAKELGSLNHQMEVAAGRNEAGPTTLKVTAPETGKASEAGSFGDSVRTESTSVTRGLERGTGIVAHLADQLHGARNQDEAADLMRDIKWTLRGMRDEELRANTLSAVAKAQREQEQERVEYELHRLNRLLSTTDDTLIRDGLRNWVTERAGALDTPASKAAA